MKISPRTLAELDQSYSISVLPTGSYAKGELPGFFCGSGSEQGLLYFAPPNFAPEVVAETPGGFISTWPLLRGNDRFLIAAAQFKPGFMAADSALLLYRFGSQERADPSLVAPLPFAHRLGLFSHGRREFLIATTLCGGKADIDDWSQPGGVYLARVPDKVEEPWEVRQIIGGLKKNHGMDRAHVGPKNAPGYLLSSAEGLLFLPVPVDPDGKWVMLTIDKSETSDAFAFDWDGDGEAEVFSIGPFHGNMLRIHRRNSEGWNHEIIAEDLGCGHVVWAGPLFGRPALLTGSWKGRGELRLYRPDGNGGVDRDYGIIDEGIGPSRLAVVSRGNRAYLYVAANAINEVRLYELEE